VHVRCVGLNRADTGFDSDGFRLLANLQLHILARDHGNVANALELRPRTLVALFERTDGFRKPERFSQMLLASECDARGREGGGVSFRDKPFPQKEYLEKALAAARGVNAGEIAQRCADRPEKIPEFVRAARVRAVKEAIGFDGEDEEGAQP